MLIVLNLFTLYYQTVTFEIQHKPGYRLKIRAGFHSGAVVGGVVGTKVIYIASTVGLLWEVLWELTTKVFYISPTVAVVGNNVL